jgi:hypothetical protein
MEKFPEIKLKMVPGTEEAKSIIGYTPALEEIGTRHKLGGVPDYVQEEDWPKCPSCHSKMSFYGQLDSVGSNMTIADCGMIYVFLCFDCYEAKAIVQSY